MSHHCPACLLNLSLSLYTGQRVSCMWLVYSVSHSPFIQGQRVSCMWSWRSDLAPSTFYPLNPVACPISMVLKATHPPPSVTKAILVLYNQQQAETQSMQTHRARRQSEPSPLSDHYPSSLGPPRPGEPTLKEVNGTHARGQRRASLRRYKLSPTAYHGSNLRSGFMV